jgi:hypothetical protein
MRLLVVLASSAAIVGLAATAHADPGSDANFIAALRTAGITYKSEPDAEGTGHRACELMDQGHPESDVVKSMTQQNAGLSADTATRFTHIAEEVYCPQHNGGVVTPPPPQPTPANIEPYFPWPPIPAAF